MADTTSRRAPLIKIEINTPYYVGEVEAACLPKAQYDLLISNVEGVHEPNGHDPSWGTTDKKKYANTFNLNKVEHEESPLKKKVIMKDNLINDEPWKSEQEKDNVLIKR